MKTRVLVFGEPCVITDVSVKGEYCICKDVTGFKFLVESKFVDEVNPWSWYLHNTLNLIKLKIIPDYDRKLIGIYKVIGEHKIVNTTNGPKAIYMTVFGRHED